MSSTATAYLKVVLDSEINSDILPHSTKSVVFVMKKKCAFSEVETAYLYVWFS